MLLILNIIIVGTLEYSKPGILHIAETAYTHTLNHQRSRSWGICKNLHFSLDMAGGISRVGVKE